MKTIAIPWSQLTTRMYNPLPLRSRIYNSNLFGIEMCGIPRFFLSLFWHLISTCCLLLQRISFSSLEVKFYGLRDLPGPLVAEYNIKGKLTQLNLVNSALLQLLQSHLNCKGSPLFLEAGFKMFQIMW